MEHGRFRNWLSHYPESSLLIACKDGSGYQLCIEAEGECLCLTDSEGGRLTFTSLAQAEGFLRAHQIHQARLRVYDAQNEDVGAESQEIIIKF
ncbi:DUF6482 family protein [Aeromonas jandaei]|jgi:hypothetical protein|uniref:DUF1488 domain-containing protein n=1 Tax=Aeromonas jandaei TaxID=650 RepID=A0ABX6ZQY9_AERJA|nr:MULTISPECIES: DUF6482 family protein [Aeromonas]KIQ78389.1 hypothetical protein RW26_18205 [Aeromonas sp. L_1B5_3]MBL0626127.1 hypothetical protein [Aeromonas jandaei]MBL0667093.1 hypothetical protein [Aeromonas jandaei]MBW3760841.1 hypothetical protein [Aeromonas jandaei]MBW3804472.1 hypothetical protein [Aeromonas jandaei]